MLPDKCDNYDPNLAKLKFVYWLEWAHISNKVHKEEYIHGGYVWVYSTESKINISEFSLQLQGIRKENYLLAEQKQSSRSGKFIVKIEKKKEIKWRNYSLYYQDLKCTLENSCPWRNLALLDIIKSNEVKIKKVRLQTEYEKSNSLTVDLRFALCGTKSSFYLLSRVS